MTTPNTRSILNFLKKGTADSINEAITIEVNKIKAKSLKTQSTATTIKTKTARMRVPVDKETNLKLFPSFIAI